MRNVSSKWAHPKHDVHILKNHDIFFHDIRGDPDIPSDGCWKRGETAETSRRTFPSHGRPRNEELARLRKENKALRSANEILKKTAAIFAQRDTP